MNTLCYASLILLAPAGIVILYLLIKFVWVVYAAGARLNRWLVLVTLAGLIIGIIALVLLIKGS